MRPDVEKAYDFLVSRYGFQNDGAFAHAFSAKCPVYPGTCDIHFNTVFLTRSKTCEKCTIGARGQARKEGAAVFLSNCPTHGSDVAHRTKSGRCVACAEGGWRSASPRAVARREGATTFARRCETCDLETAHRVSNGSCTFCCTVHGTRRVHADGRRGPAWTHGARAVARRAGEKTFLQECPDHGETAHDVVRGLCLQCFTTMGSRRHAAQPTRDTPRAQARRSGVSSYTDTCPTHGVTAYHTVRGLCLQCFDTLGHARPRDDTVRVTQPQEPGRIRLARWSHEKTLRLDNVDYFVVPDSHGRLYLAPSGAMLVLIVDTA